MWGFRIIENHCSLQQNQSCKSLGFRVLCKGYPLGFPWNSLCFARGTPDDFHVIPYVLQGVALRIPMEYVGLQSHWKPLFLKQSQSCKILRFRVLCKGCPLWFPWNSFCVARGAPDDFHAIPYVLKEVPLMISMQFPMFCKGDYALPGLASRDYVLPSLASRGCVMPRSTSHLPSLSRGGLQHLSPISWSMMLSFNFIQTK